MNDFIERELSEIREDLARIKDFFQGKSFHNLAMQRTLIEYRQLPESAIADLDAFFVPDREEFSVVEYPKWMHEPDLKFMLPNKECRFAGRLILPIKTVRGEIAGFTGWSAFESPKYLDSTNVGYIKGFTTFFGMENLPTYYRNDRPVYVTEGLMCVAYLRSKGFQAMSSLGSNLSKYQAEVLKRLGRRCIMVPDNDATGLEWAKRLQWQLPKASIICVTHGKDIDGCRKADEHAYEEKLISDLYKLESSNPFQYFDEIIKIK